MPTWEWTLSDGRKVQGDGATQEEAWHNYLDARRIIDTPKDPEERRAIGLTAGTGTPWDVIKGIGQGLIDPIEGAVQLAEHLTHKKLAPESLRDLAREFRKNVESTTAGQIGELGGNVVGAFVPGMAVGRGLTGLTGLAARAAAGAAIGAAQPVTHGDDFTATKLNQASIGALATGLPSIAGQASRLAPLTGHFSTHHPFLSMFPRTARALGVAARDLPPAAVAAPAATAYEESEAQ